MRRFFIIVIFIAVAGLAFSNAGWADSLVRVPSMSPPGYGNPQKTDVSNSAPGNVAHGAVKLSDLPPSPFEEFTKSEGLMIKQFGYDLFTQIPDTFAPVQDLPVGPDYILGPGDQLRISVWGKINGDYTSWIDRDGKITLPYLGVLYVSGLTFSEAKTFLDQEMARYFNPAEVKMNVSMGALRSIRVFIIGKVRRPGSYTVSSFATVIQSILAAGGPSKNGSLRDIQVKRNGSTITHFDFYDFLLKGDKTKDVRLMPEDVVFVPPVGPLAGISGSVNEPGIYELKDEKTLKELIAMAGGFNDIVFKSRFQINRIVDKKYEIVFESSLDKTDPEEITIQPGDFFRFYPVVQDKKVVRLEGAVQRGGEYGIGNGLTVKELVMMSGGLKYFAYLDEAELTRINVTQRGPETVKLKLDLSRAMEGDPANDVKLQPNDYLFVRAVPEWDLYRVVTINGEVRFPGSYTIMKGETISSLIARAGGFTGKAYLKGAVFQRQSVRELQQRQLDESIDRLEYEIIANSSKALETSLNEEGRKIQETAIAQKQALIAKMRAARAKGRISLNLSSLEKFKGSPSDLALEKGDVLEVPARPAQVQVIGSVYNQTAFVYKDDYSLNKYLKKAGGVTENANEDDIYILKVDGTSISRKSTDWGIRWDSENSRWESGGFMSLRLDPGDTIVVPEKIEKVAWLKEIKDMTQILYQIAVTAGVLIVAF